MTRHVRTESGKCAVGLALEAPSPGILPNGALPFPLDTIGVKTRPVLIVQPGPFLEEGDCITHSYPWAYFEAIKNTHIGA